MFDDEYDLEELEPPRPYTPEQREAIDEINAEIAKAFAELCQIGGV